MTKTSRKISVYALAGGLVLSLSACSQQQFKEFVNPSEPFEVKEEWDGWWSQYQSDVITFGGDIRILGAYVVDTKTRLCFFLADGGSTEIPCGKLANRKEWAPIITWESGSN